MYLFLVLMLKNAPNIRNKKKHTVIEEYNNEQVFIVPHKTKIECEADLKLKTELQAK